MHTTIIGNQAFHHNGDFTGNVKFLVSAESIVNYGVDQDGKDQIEVNFPFELMRGLVLEYLREKLIRNFENMSFRELEDWATIGDNHEHELTTMKPWYSDTDALNLNNLI